MRIRSTLAQFCAGIAALVLGVAPTLPAHAADGPYYVDFSGAAAANVQIQGGTGTFAFRSTTCVQIDADDPLLQPTCTMVAAGTFNNTVCGTGTASGTATITNDPSDGGSETVNLHIQFLLGNGIVSGDASGDVQIVPVAPTTPPGCASTWAVKGDLLIP